MPWMRIGRTFTYANKIFPARMALRNAFSMRYA